jgi:tetratricopeptide (TPR) repeat protein
MATSSATRLFDTEPQVSAAYNEQAISCALEGRLEEAVACLEEVLRLQPDSAGARNNLGNVLSLQGKQDEAVASYQQALCLNPDFAEAYSNLGDTLSSMGRYDEALTHCRQALRLQPSFAGAHHNLGNAYRGLGKLSEALACYQQALLLNPDWAETRINIGVALAGLNQLDEAVAHYREALRLQPDCAEAWSNLGRVFVKQGKWEDASGAFQRALEGQRNQAQAYYNLGYTLGEQGKPAEAANCFRQALRLKPDDVTAHWALALSLLVQGDFEQGWPEYEWRWRLNGWSPQQLTQPVWDGSSLAGRTILLYGEGGLGDTIQFVRYAAVVKRYGGSVIVSCQKLLLPLLASCPGIDRLVAVGSELPAFDVQAPLLNLPRILKTSLATVPAETPYLFPDAKLQEKWQRKLSHYPGFTIGIAWQGNPQFYKDRKRSIPLIQFAPLARIPGVHLISLQKGQGTEQLRLVADEFPVIDLGNRLDKRSGAFLDTAAIMKNVDLIITSDTAIAHLAGALGVSVWVALSYVPEWRWLLQREDCPWYPSMRLFRQTHAGDWEEVFDRMAHELSRRLAGSHRTGCLRIEISPGELLDKVTILEIKTKKIRDGAKLRHIRAELAALQAVRDREIAPSQEIALLTSELKEINWRLWQVEDKIRVCEQTKDFGPRFVELARSVYLQNDCRSALKRRLNELLDSCIREEKLYSICLGK